MYTNQQRFPIASLSALGAAALALATTACVDEAGPGLEDPETTASARPALTTGPRAPFPVFETGQVRPLALSLDQRHLFAVNTPDHRLEVFRVGSRKLTHLASIPVGLEPVAVAVRSDREVWVVNHLSDSVSIVELESGNHRGHVARTLLVGDEPRDIVFAGPGRQRAFITAAHRGQNVPFDPQLTTAGVGRADVWVFDAAAPGGGLGGTPLTIVSLFTDTPRALAVAPDGTRVYAAGFHTGNQTTIVAEQSIPDGFGPDGVAGPATNAAGAPAPEVGAIVKWNGAHWVDTLGRARDEAVKLALPDKDVFVLDAMANPPRQLAGPTGFFQRVGTVLFAMATNPVTGKIYVTNTEANNAARFEGPGTFAGSTLRGHLHESRITVLTPGGGVAPRHLNKHIRYDVCCGPPGNPEAARSLALPQGMAVTDDGATLYVAALGSDKIGVLSTQELENDSFVPSTASQIRVRGGGPTGLVLDPRLEQLYVMTRFDNAISVIDTRRREEVTHVAMHSAEPASVVNGRRHLYDAERSSSHGDSACASCHVFGDLDSLAWDLGNPDAQVVHNPGPFASPLPFDPSFHPMKGPMVTQSLRGLANHGPMHWRGDRTGGNDAPTAQPDSGSFDERAAFRQFQGAFATLLGRSAPIPDADMNAFTDYMLQVSYPPNPNQPLDGSLTPAQAAGRQLFQTFPFANPLCPDGSCGTLTCATCHPVDPQSNPGTAMPGTFGTLGFSTFDFRPQILKIPHLRNLYQKIGMFGNAPNPLVLPGDHQFKGDQIRGFGFQHNGEVDTIFRFHQAVPFSAAAGATGIPVGPSGDVLRRQLEAYVLAFPSNLAPVVGQQITLTATSPAAVSARVTLLRQRADAGDCDLIAKTERHHDEAGFFYAGGGRFTPDRRKDAAISEAELRRIATADGDPVTFTCVPPGSGERLGVDRDGDGVRDGDERR